MTSKGKISSSAINSYNRKMAELMNESVKNVTAPSGRVVQFVAKRGEVGVHMALADRGYDMQQLKNGIWASGRLPTRRKMLIWFKEVMIQNGDVFWFQTETCLECIYR